jgi:hypothetical protein
MPFVGVPQTGNTALPVLVQNDMVFSGPVPTVPVPSVRNEQGRREFFSWELNENTITFYDSSQQTDSAAAPAPESITSGHEFVFLVELVQSATNEVIANQYIVYRTPDASVNEMLSVIVNNMLLNIPLVEDRNSWRYDWLFFDSSIIWSPRYNYSDLSSFGFVNFGFNMSAEFHFTNTAAAGIGFGIIQERVSTDTGTSEDTIFELPIYLKYVHGLSVNETLEPYTGVSLNFSLGNESKPSLLSWFFGLQYGVKTGPGMLIFDPRFCVDIFTSSADNFQYRRVMLYIGIGYKYGFLQKRGNAGN